MENFNKMNIYRFDILIRISESNHENSTSIHYIVKLNRA